MSSVVLLAGVAWIGWALAAAAALTLRRRLALMADAEHELRGAATAIGLAFERMSRTGSTAELEALVALQLDRTVAGLADLAAARGGRRPPGGSLDAGRLAQVLANVVGNAAEHGVGPVEVSARRAAGEVRLEVSNRAAAGRTAALPGRGRGVAIAERAARELGGRLSVESADGVTHAVVELPRDLPSAPDSAPDSRRAA